MAFLGAPTGKSSTSPGITDKGGGTAHIGPFHDHDDDDDDQQLQAVFPGCRSCMSVIRYIEVPDCMRANGATTQGRRMPVRWLDG